ncbi:hypothetical protein BD324DRAFT_636616 [Kockovaella imperatae]|uniref:Chromatin structure-remodeling complex subunit SFH1 n=1 Tax=Kockovaella imperatae TaxID=4999 RepID=A0A1Y1U7T6_9TREE|nr:hypothetical protein BD324DRAFT_636616 [Kockovaella imperatae]ORX34100.1 hypothetical protein BD324DRAFT_636616 [Kockovaella imperatae]
MSSSYPSRSRPVRQAVLAGGSTSNTSTSGVALPTLPNTRPGPSYSQTRPYNRQQPPGSTTAYPPRPIAQTSQHHAQQAVPQVPIYYHAPTHPEGPLAFFVPPPGQPTRDPTLSNPPTAQALHSTYPSRLRTGVTGLIQPETITGGPREREYLLAELDRELAAVHSGASTPRLESPAPTGGAGTGAGAGMRRPTTTLSGRATGRRVNYAEEESDEESEESSLSELEEPPSDPDDTSYGERGDRKRRDRSSDVRARSTVPAWTGLSAMDQQAQNKAAKIKRKRDELDRGWTWLGDRVPGERVTSTSAQATRHSYPSEELLRREAGRPTVLVPITIDFDVPSQEADKQGIKVKDRFLWNMNEPFITPHQFATTFCKDIGIPHTFATTMAELIQSQLDEASGCVDIDLVDREVTADDVIWSEDEPIMEEYEEVSDEVVPEAPRRKRGRPRKYPRPLTDRVSESATPALTPVPEVEPAASHVDEEDGNEGDQEEEAANGEHVEEGDNQGEGEGTVEPAENEDEAGPVVVKRRRKIKRVWQEPDCRITINLDVQIYTHILRDRIEWDLASSLPPAVFAKQYCAELGLSGEAIPLVAHAITDELLKHKRDALELDLFSETHPLEQAKWERGGAGGMKVNSRYGASQLVGVWRDWWEREEYSPVLVELTMEEMERRDLERNRESRRMLRTLGPKRRR